MRRRKDRVKLENSLGCSKRNTSQLVLARLAVSNTSTLAYDFQVEEFKEARNG